MLVLTRKEGESIIIGGEIIVTVSQIQRSRVRFAIDAPKDVRVLRGELQPRTAIVTDREASTEHLPHRIVH